MFQRENEENVATLELSVQEFASQDLSSVATFVLIFSLIYLALNDLIPSIISEDGVRLPTWRGD